MLDIQERPRSEDKGSEDENAQVDGWTYNERYDQERSYKGQGVCDLCVEEDERGKVEMVRPCEKEAHGCASKKV